MSSSNAGYKPDGYTDLSPYLCVADAQAGLDFVTAVFGTTPLRIHRGDDGVIVHAEARVGDSVLMVGQTPEATPACLHVYVPDPDAAFDAAIAAGATAIQPVADHPDGDRRGGVSDPSGTQWFFGRVG